MAKRRKEVFVKGCSPATGKVKRIAFGDAKLRYAQKRSKT